MVTDTYFKRALLMLDGDDAGRAATDECLKRLGRRMFVKALEVPEGKQPDEMVRKRDICATREGTENQWVRLCSRMK